MKQERQQFDDFVGRFNILLNHQSYSPRIRFRQADRDEIRDLKWVNLNPDEVVALAPMIVELIRKCLMEDLEVADSTFIKAQQKIEIRDRLLRELAQAESDLRTVLLATKSCKQALDPNTSKRISAFQLVFDGGSWLLEPTFATHQE